METELRYLEEMDVLEGSAEVLAVRSEGGRDWIELEGSHFHPQGGGQPADRGVIRGPGRATFVVDDVRIADGVVRHFGEWEGEDRIAGGEMASYAIDEARRSLLSRIHSAGHVIDMAVHELGIGWFPGKGYHFPDSPYVEYEGHLPEEREELCAAIETRARAIVSRPTPTRVVSVDADRLGEVVVHVPKAAPSEGEVRVVLYGTFGVPCGGTHVSQLDRTGSISVRKIKGKKGSIRVSYDVDRSV